MPDVDQIKQGNREARDRRGPVFLGQTGQSRRQAAARLAVSGEEEAPTRKGAATIRRICC